MDVFAELHFVIGNSEVEHAQHVVLDKEAGAPDLLAAGAFLLPYLSADVHAVEHPAVGRHPVGRRQVIFDQEVRRSAVHQQKCRPKPEVADVDLPRLHVVHGGELVALFVVGVHSQADRRHARRAEGAHHGHAMGQQPLQSVLRRNHVVIQEQQVRGVEGRLGQLHVALLVDESGSAHEHLNHGALLARVRNHAVDRPEGRGRPPPVRQQADGDFVTCGHQLLC